MPGTLIADDTPLIRSTLVRILTHRHLAPTPIVEACNGEDAIRLAREVRPEIVLMDIRMPGLDGLQATSVIRTEVPEARVVMLTAYDEFAYAQKALKLGVTDYLLKPVRPDKLEETFTDIANGIRRERERSRDIVGSTAALEHVLPVVERNLVENLIRDALPESDSVLDSIAYLQREIVWPAVIVIKPDDYAAYVASNSVHAVRTLYERMVAITNRNLPEPHRSLVGYSSPGRIIAIVSADGELEPVKARRMLGERIRRQVQQETEITVTVGLGERCPTLDSIPLSYAEANLARRVHASGNVVVHIDDLTTGRCTDMHYLDPVQSECDFVRAIQGFQPDQAYQLFNEILDTLAKRHRDELAPWQNHCAELIALAAWGVVNTRVPTEQVLAVLHSQVMGLAAARNVNEVRSWALNSLMELLGMIDSMAEPDNPVGVALDYIRQEYTRPDLSLNEVADVVGFSPSHLSTLFKEQTGQTYIRTLTALRLEQARHLLRTTDNSVAAVALAVGYRHTTNFYRHFHREEGMTPGDYREAG
jgi:two-component system response regulator YesN